jgi:uncharacterized protein (TIGR02996 family)
MLEHVAFLAAIRVDPRSIVDRLVYADWLEEQGEVLADLLRVQAQLLQIGELPSIEELARQEWELLKRHRRRWKQLHARLRPWPEAAGCLHDHILTALSQDPDGFACPACGGRRHWRWDVRNPLVLHWVVNPALAVNELVLGQRIPAVMYTCTSCWPMRTYTHCPGCRGFLDIHAPPFNQPLGNWRGLRCPQCATNIPLLQNLVTAAVLLTGKLLSGHGWLWGRQRPPSPPEPA